MKTQQAFQDYLRRRRRLAVVYSAGIGLISFMLAVYIWQYMKLVEIQFAITGLQKEMAAVQEQIELKQAERAFLSRLERIEEVATRKLGMGLPAKEQMWYVPVASTSLPGR
jgi:cell division protein FtsL